jgi:nucleotide-binding universal stress UspA family protein
MLVPMGSAVKCQAEARIVRNARRAAGEKFPGWRDIPQLELRLSRWRDAWRACPRRSEHPTFVASELPEIDSGRANLLRQECEAAMFKRILVATDLTATSNEAMATGVALARMHCAALRIVHVVNDLVNDPWSIEPYAMDYRALVAFIGKTRAVARQELALRIARVTPPLLNARVDVLVGKPADELLKYAAEAHVDLIVLGSRGRNPVQRAVLGSVADRVVREAECPVLVVRSASAAESTSDAA